MKRVMFLILLIPGIIVLLGLIFIPFRFFAKTSENVNPAKSIQIIAHRGASGLAPENTMPAIDFAMDAKTDCIEIDVHLSKDNKIVVMHDYSVDRTTDGTGEISELDSTYIKTLDAGSFFGPPFIGTKVPFLEEVLERVNAKTKLLIEIKEKRTVNTGIEKEVVKLIKKYHAEKWCIVQSFNDESLEEVHNISPEIELQKLLIFKLRFLPVIFDGGFTYFDFKKYGYVSSLNMHVKFSANSFLKTAHSNGKKVIAWGCAKKGSCTLEEMKIWDGIITNYPADYRK